MSAATLRAMTYRQVLMLHFSRSTCLPSATAAHQSLDHLFGQALVAEVLHLAT